MPKLHDVLDFDPDFLHDPLIRLMLLVNLVNGASFAQVLIRLDDVE